MPRRLPALLCLFLLVPGRATAEEPSSPGSGITWKSAALFLGGAATAFVAHEGCHVVANYALGSTPRIQPVTFAGAIPFFSINPGVNCQGDRCWQEPGKEPWGPGRAGLYAIAAAGLQCQQIENEVILSLTPDLRHREAPFRKGMLAFNLALSFGYAFAEWGGLDPGSGDLSTMQRLTPGPKGLMAAVVLLPALLDALRYLLPEATWLPWVSRVSRGALVGFVFAF